MSKLVWDQTGTREFEAGVSQVALFPINDEGSYTTGVAWSGVTAINENPSGADATDLYADDIKYATLRSAERFGFTIEAYDYPPEWSECDGSKEAENAPGVFIGQQARKAFGLVYKTKIGDDTHPGMDKGYKLHIVYNSTASPSSRGYATINENPDAISFSWEANSTPVSVSGLKACSTIVIDSTRCNASKLTALENTIYGTDAGDGVDATSPTLPEPDDVIDALKTTASGGGSTQNGGAEGGGSTQNGGAEGGGSTQNGGAEGGGSTQNGGTEGGQTSNP